MLEITQYATTPIKFVGALAHPNTYQHSPRPRDNKAIFDVVEFSFCGADAEQAGRSCIKQLVHQFPPGFSRILLSFQPDTGDEWLLSFRHRSIPKETFDNWLDGFVSGWEGFKTAEEA